MKRSQPQIFIFCHHKVGTVLFLNMMKKIAQYFGLSGTSAFGYQTSVNSNADIVVFGHSLIGFDLDAYDYRGLHLVRDPRDVWVSGYLYHQRCREPWCINTDLVPTYPIRFPQVPLSQQHRPEPWKASYLDGLGGKSYQANLLSLDRRDGLRFELDRYAAWTIESMTAWKPAANVLEMRMETFSEDFDAAVSLAFDHFGFSGDMHSAAVKIARTEDVARMDDRQLAANPHIHSRRLSKWRDFLDGDDVATFMSRFGDALPLLGYDE